MSDRPENVEVIASDDSFPLEEATEKLSAEDRRPRVPEPLPVRLIAVGDVRLPASPGVERELDAFYAGLWGFERMDAGLVYRADNYYLRFDVKDEPVVHESLRALVIEVPSLAEATHKLQQTKLEFTRQKGVAPGTESIVMLDPAGNWIELVETRLLL